MRVIVTGSRAWKDKNRIWRSLDLMAANGPLTVVHGDCPDGADAMAAEWCRYALAISCGVGIRSYLVTEEPYPAKWKTYGKAAGHIRNGEMVALGADVVLAFCAWCDNIMCPRHDIEGDHMTHGTENCVRQARAAGIEVLEFWEAQ